MTLSPDMHARIFGPRPLDQIFARPGAGGRDTVDAGVLATYRGPFADQVLGAFDKLGLTKRAARDAQGSDAANLVADVTSDAAHAVQPGRVAEVTTSNPVYGGLLAERMYADAGQPLPRYVAPVGDAGVVATPEVAAGAVAGGGAAEAVAKPATAAELSMMKSFEQLSTLTEAQRIDVLSGALEHRAAAGAGPSMLEVLTRAVIEGPFEDSAPAMQRSLDRVLASATADVAPAVAEVAASTHPAPAVAAVVEHVAPSALDEAVAGARALLHGGAPTKLVGMEDGIRQALKLLRA